MSDGTVEQLIDHQAQLQRQVDRLSREILIVSVCAFALSILILTMSRRLAVLDVG